MKSSWIELVIERASASPITSATSWMMRKSTATTTRTPRKTSPSVQPCTFHRLRVRQPLVELAHLNESATDARVSRQWPSRTQSNRLTRVAEQREPSRARRLRGSRDRHRAVWIGPAQRHRAGLHASPLVELVQHLAVERQVDDDPPDGRRRAPGRPHRTNDELDFVRRIRAGVTAGRAGEPIRLGANPRRRELGWSATPREVLPRSAGHARWTGRRRRDEHHRERRIAECRRSIALHAIDGLLRRPRDTPDLSTAADFRQQLDLSAILS